MLRIVTYEYVHGYVHEYVHEYVYGYAKKIGIRIRIRNMASFYNTGFVYFLGLCSFALFSKHICLFKNQGLFYVILIYLSIKIFSWPMKVT